MGGAAPDEARGGRVGQFGDGLHRLGRLQQQQRSRPAAVLSRGAGGVRAGAQPALAAFGQVAVKGGGASHRVLAQLGLQPVDEPGQGVDLDLRCLLLPGQGRLARGQGLGLQGAQHQGVGPKAQVQMLQSLFLEQAHHMRRRARGRAQPRRQALAAAVGAKGVQRQHPRAHAVALQLSGQGLGKGRQGEGHGVHVDHRLGQGLPHAIVRWRTLPLQRLARLAQGLVQTAHQGQGVRAAKAPGQARTGQGVKVADPAQAQPGQQARGL